MPKDLPSYVCLERTASHKTGTMSVVASLFQSDAHPVRKEHTYIYIYYRSYTGKITEENHTHKLRPSSFVHSDVGCLEKKRVARPERPLTE